MTELIMPQDGALVSQKTDVMRLFERDIAKNAWVNMWGSFASGEEGPLTEPLPVRFEWKTDECGAVFALSEDSGFAASVPHRVSGNSAYAENLLLGKKYYWKVGNSEIRTFVTEDVPPRWIHTTRASNVRDIGGYPALEGRKVRQRMIYRGTRIFRDGDPSGLKTLRDDLGIVFELDLRSSAEAESYSSRIGGGVRYERIESEGYGDFLVLKRNIPKYFAVLTDVSNYPMYIHCAGGADRTGTLVSMILSLLGVDEETLTREFECSTLCFPHDHKSRKEEGWREFTAALRILGGDFGKGIRKFVLSTGVSEEQIDRLREILLEPSEI
ncbi:MAG: tyrosine-protein phosphatase [Clostridia bacterium]|nr:tyrosine-protein phosphatase [Clostridia bacterium]